MTEKCEGKDESTAHVVMDLAVCLRVLYRGQRWPCGDQFPPHFFLYFHKIKQIYVFFGKPHVLVETVDKRGLAELN